MAILRAADPAAAAAVKAGVPLDTVLSDAFRPIPPMNSRGHFAALPPSLVFLGFALHELAATIAFMLSRPASWRTPLFRLAFVAWLFCLLETIAELMLYDYQASPYIEPLPHWHALLSICAFVLNSGTIICVVSLFIVRLNVLHSDSPLIFWGLTSLGIISILLEIPASAVGTMMNLEIIRGEIAYLPQSKHLGLSNNIFAAAHTIVGAFSAMASFAFLWAIGQNLGLSNKEIVREVLINHEGIRFFAGLGLNIVFAGLAIHAYAWGFNYITWTVYVLPPWIFALEIHAFLLTSYVSTRKMFQDHGEGKIGSKSNPSNPANSAIEQTAGIEPTIHPVAGPNIAKSYIPPPQVMYDSRPSMEDYRSGSAYRDAYGHTSPVTAMSPNLYRPSEEYRYDGSAHRRGVGTFRTSEDYPARPIAVDDMDYRSDMTKGVDLGRNGYPTMDASYRMINKTNTNAPFYGTGNRVENMDDDYRSAVSAAQSYGYRTRQPSNHYRNENLYDMPPQGPPPPPPTSVTGRYGARSDVGVLNASINGSVRRNINSTGSNDSDVRTFGPATPLPNRANGTGDYETATSVAPSVVNPGSGIEMRSFSSTGVSHAGTRGARSNTGGMDNTYDQYMPRRVPTPGPSATHPHRDNKRF